MKHISLIIPCHNEENGIKEVIQNIPYENLERHGYELSVLVIDNNSTDGTAEVAKELGARVIQEPKKGKGNAIMTGFNNVPEHANYVVMLDGDNTYKIEEMLRLVEPLDSGFADVIVGSRLSGKMKENSFKTQNRIVNWGFTFLVRRFYFANVTDVLTGYFAWKKDVVDDLKKHLVSEGFTIEMEMITKMVKLGHDIYSVPITYDRRLGESKIESLKDGASIMHMFFKNLFWKPELKASSKAYNFSQNRSALEYEHN